MTPMMRQYHDIKARYSDSILLFRLGDFYECFYDDAKIISKTLQLVLTSRNGVPMAGIPHHALDNYLKKLIAAGYKVAICDQVEDVSQAQGIVKRDVIRVVTPGTVVEDGLLQRSEASFLGCVVESTQFALLLLDISQNQGMIFMKESWEEVVDLLHRYAPSQVLLSEGPEWEYRRDHLKRALPSLFVELLAKWYFNPSKAQEEVSRAFSPGGSLPLDTRFLEYPQEATLALAAALKYMTYQKLATSLCLNPPKIMGKDAYMSLDAATQENLNLVPSAYGAHQGKSLYGHMNRCVTAGGSRLLRSWMLAPLRNVESIRQRYDFIQALIEHFEEAHRIDQLLGDTYDLARIVSRLRLLKSTAKDMVSLKKTLTIIPRLREEIQSVQEDFSSPPSIFHSLMTDLHAVPELREYLESSMEDEPQGSVGEGDTVRSGFDQTLDEYRDIMDRADAHLKEMECAERSRTGINSLKIGHNNVYGFYIEISKTHLDKAPDDYQRKQTLVSSERYTTKSLQVLEEKIEHAKEWVSRLEKQAIDRILSHCGAFIDRLQALSEALAMTDVLQSFAQLAVEYGYCRPALDTGSTLKIVQGRHPVLESVEDHVHPNDIALDFDTRFIILTGPNMSGKSTFLRQIALICIMAQMGSFVPASSALLPVLDRVFSRIGARDDIASGRSTFLVEMSETATILQHATKASLVLLDEVGRGTSTYDGISIAWAVSEYLHSILSPFCLFATHYNELTELAVVYPAIKNMRVKVLEEKGEVIFLHQVEDGVSDRSYGIEVARIAGLPPQVVERASEVLETITSEYHLQKRVRVLGEKELERVRKSSRMKKKIADQQISIFDMSDTCTKSDDT